MVITFFSPLLETGITLTIHHSILILTLYLGRSIFFVLALLEVKNAQLWNHLIIHFIILNLNHLTDSGTMVGTGAIRLVQK